MSSTSSDTLKGLESRIPEIPPHWIFERSKHNRLTDFLHHALCAIGLGHVDLDGLWEVGHAECPDEVWEHCRDQLRKRFEHINVVAGLLFFAMSTFTVTNPPANLKQAMPYTNAAAFAIGLSNNLAMGGLIVGSAAAFVCHKIDLQWFREVLMSSKARIWGTMIILSYPFLSVATATCAAGIGLLTTLSYSEITWLRIFGFIFAAPPALCGLVLCWMLCVKTGTLGM